MPEENSRERRQKGKERGTDIIVMTACKSILLHTEYSPRGLFPLPQNGGGHLADPTQLFLTFFLSFSISFLALPPFLSLFSLLFFSQTHCANVTFSKPPTLLPIHPNPHPTAPHCSPSPGSWLATLLPRNMKNWQAARFICKHTAKKKREEGGGGWKQQEMEGRESGRREGVEVTQRRRKCCRRRRRCCALPRRRKKAEKQSEQRESRQQRNKDEFYMHDKGRHY